MHKNHRERVKKRFLEETLDAFASHNVLEFLLFYAIPQRDTNETAHRLMRRFGSLSGVLDAPYEELMEVEGMGMHSAALLKLVPVIYERYREEKKREVHPFSDMEAVGRYFLEIYRGVTEERVYLLLLDNKFDIIDCVKVHDGSVNSAAIKYRTLVELVLTRQASTAILAHNHPNGVPIPSPDDIHTTSEIRRVFALLGIHLMGHILVAGDYFVDLDAYGRQRQAD